ncbi:MAG: SRPBCC family protein [Gemmatimonadaceae bacterium]
MKRQLLAAILASSAVSTAEAQDRQIRLEVVVPARPAVVWALWTTSEGVKSFFAPASNIDLRVDGLYEIFFMPSAPTGLKGADGMRLLVVEPYQRLAFTWNAPPDLPEVRAQRTVVIVDLKPVGRDSTAVVLRHLGWGTGPKWDAALAYFDDAWKDAVLPFLKYRIERGPIDWMAPPKVSPIARTGIQHLTVAAK